MLKYGDPFIWLGPSPLHFPGRQSNGLLRTGGGPWDGVLVSWRPRLVLVLSDLRVEEVGKRLDDWW